MTEKNDIPKHIGFIVDGNRRWAKEHGLPNYEGHLAGYEALKTIALATLDAGVKYMSAYAWSTENWKRSKDEAMRIMSLTLKVLKQDISQFQDKNVRLVVLGSREGLSSKLVKSIEEAEELTKNNTNGTFALCFNYGGQQEIVDAMKKMIEEGARPSDITTETISQNLYGADLPPLDIIVRTGGEKRLSNFMLWRSAYSELLFLDKYWPDMTKEDLDYILEEYKLRQRRFGG